MRTPEENRVLMQEAFERAFPQARQIRAVRSVDASYYTGHRYPCPDLYIVRMVMGRPGQEHAYGCQIVYDEREMSINYPTIDVFAREVHHMIEVMKERIRKDGFETGFDGRAKC